MAKNLKQKTYKDTQKAHLCEGTPVQARQPRKDTMFKYLLWIALGLTVLFAVCLLIF